MIGLLHPYVLDYREDFFKGLKEEFELDIFCYEPPQDVKKFSHKKSLIEVDYVHSWSIKGVLLYNPFIFIQKKYDLLVLMLSATHLTTWILLLTKPLHKKKIILWGHGISIKRFLVEERKPSILLKLMISKADLVWFYTTNELDLWRKEIPTIKGISLNNTLSNIDSIVSHEKVENIDELKKKYKIIHNRIIIYCARFSTLYRRSDLLEGIIQLANSNSIGFIIIGDGMYKPDFKKYSNVYDYGSVYDMSIKKDLFDLSDIYLQPGWVGLSIVEAMAYGKPVFTFKRKSDILQCVEYVNIVNNYNGILFESVTDLVNKLESISNEEISILGENAKSFVRNNLTMRNMIDTALSSIKSI